MAAAAAAAAAEPTKTNEKNKNELCHVRNAGSVTFICYGRTDGRTLVHFSVGQDNEQFGIGLVDAHDNNVRVRFIGKRDDVRVARTGQMHLVQHGIIAAIIGAQR